MNNQKRAEIFLRLREANPNPTTELEHQSPFELLVSVILSAQATDVSVNKATETLYGVANTPRDMLKLGEENLKGHIKSIGLFNSKAKNIMRTCQILDEEYAGQVPHTREELESLPGVGRKTANVILNTAFGEPTMAVDTHIFRISNRIKLAPGKTPRAVEDRLLKVIPEEFMKDAHHWLILHGRYVCTARNPNCGECVINDLGEYKGKL
jgi:endonuclease-3